MRTLKHDGKFLKEQNVQLTRQVTELQATVSQLESRTQETEMKNERLTIYDFTVLKIKGAKLGTSRSLKYGITFMMISVSMSPLSELNELIVSQARILPDQ